MSLFPMAGTVIKNLFSRPATRLYPFVKREPFAGTRGHVEIDFSQLHSLRYLLKAVPDARYRRRPRRRRNGKIDHLACVICGNCAARVPRRNASR